MPGSSNGPAARRPGPARRYESVTVYGLRISRGEISPAVQVPLGSGLAVDPTIVSDVPDGVRPVSVGLEEDHEEGREFGYINYARLQYRSYAQARTVSEEGRSNFRKLG